MAWSTPFVRPIINHQPDLAQTSAENEQRRRRTRKVFIIKQVQRLPATNAASGKIQRVLIFDNHPDSLRLLFGRRANPHLDLSVPNRVSEGELVFVSILAMGALFGMFWPLF